MQKEYSARGRIVYIIGLVLTLGLLLLKGNQWGERYLHLTPLESRDLFWWPLLFVTLGYIVFVERLRLSSIGLKRPGWMTLAVAALTAAALFALDPAIDWVIGLLHVNTDPGSGSGHPLGAMPYWYRAVLVVRAAVAEEVIFRGYAIERIEALTGSTTLAVIVSAAMFGYAHLAFWGWAPALNVAAGGLVLALVYVWRRDLGANILAHFIVDAIALLL
jgi:uncharacterized protein